MGQSDWDELERLAEAATAGPWRTIDFAGDVHVYAGDDECVAAYTGCYESCAVSIESRDAAFIAAADPPTVLALIARVRELEGQRGALLPIVALAECLCHVSGEEARDTAESLEAALDAAPPDLLELAMTGEDE
jgi:alkanesulfonate monooxygenase SsuD/methylene tetrahydromethanopterin reductase-like flavin-dependent oxidoreductase (luciferase family)